MSKHSATYIPLPMPVTTEDKFAMYITVDGDIEMVLYDKKYVYTPDFPDIPIEKIDLKDGRSIKQETLGRICRYMLNQLTVQYNEQYEIWEAISNDPF